MKLFHALKKKGLKIVATKLSLIKKEKAEYHYEEHKAKPFFKSLVEYMTSSPVILMVIEGDDAVYLSRKITGATDIKDAQPGTIRGDYVLHTPKNLVHTSDCIKNAKREIENFFLDNEIIEYTRNFDKWM